MEKRNGLRCSDIVIVLVCVTLALMTLGAVGQTGRERAKEVVCQANLRQWRGIFQNYIEEGNGRFPRQQSMTGWYWVTNLRQEHKDWKRMRIWLCPQASTPERAEDGTIQPVPSVFAAWGIYQGADYGPNGMAGSYGLNGYVLNVYETTTFEGGVSAKQGWRNLLDVPSSECVPLFIDALRFDLWPLYTQSPASSEFAAWSSNNMARCCINRHDGVVNCLFVDGSVRKVGLKELWTLKWHKAFNTAGPWTKAGGVGPENWPEWIRPFKDY